MKNRTSAEYISFLKNNEIFVFGSNLSGKHGKGAAKIALGWGAKYKQGEGIQGKTYGIPTKSYSVMKTLSLKDISKHVNTFLEYAYNHQELTFLVTEIGCGLAGYTVKEIAPLFKEAVQIENTHLPQKF